MPSSCATSVTMRSRSTYENGFDSGRWRSGSLGSSLIRAGSGLVIPTKTTSECAPAPRRYSRCPLWNGWNRPWIIPSWFTPSLDDDSGALLDAADAPDEELVRAELGFECRAAVGRHRYEEAARGLRVVAERFERARKPVRRHVRGRKV